MSLIKFMFSKSEHTITDDPVAVPLGVMTTIALATLPASLPIIGVLAGTAALYETGYWTVKGLVAWHNRKVERLKRTLPLPAPKPIVPPPPVITRDELLSAARARYENTLRILDRAGLDAIELHAAKAKAKQQYLRDMDGALS